MSLISIEAASAGAAPTRGLPSRETLTRAALAIAAGAAWIAFAFVTRHWPDAGEWGRGEELAQAAAGFGAALFLAGLLGGLWPRGAERLRRYTPWLLALGLFFILWQATTAKLALLPQPFFPPPHALVEVFVDDWPKLWESVVASLKLELLGFLAGAGAGFVVGVSLGWSRAFGYWVHPAMRLIGPMPSIAWLPIAFFAFPSSYSASIFLIGLTTGFPVAVLTWSGVASVNSAYYDVARTLGASRAFLIFKVAIPAALPHVFVGLFMGLGASFAVLVTAEMMGVKAGLGFYLQWAQGWAAYANMYAALLVMSLMCSGLITLLFRLRDRLLSWQKAEVQW
ncbi:NitT/TauT family transport system permease protein [Rhodoblastus acidophilus]|uniref:NitT/TauT family transport system permease protein n=1 Tax=Rhodoblastus acidophilus TaxID=1074 RepID=A0A212S2P7_RHOAC|nr:ABC transporter permease subunit [Rhodoblastus acidophilus]PPQ37609.1 ABC transporter permease [Rhodoblastus acidophilus]RAI19110.1 ABC transporter permease [Rhodoblastus acidophilus]SNB79434.1 NitT/TauT family transport system permease protein [Rhodoblastus acidophilus]